jgi:hypothetical protein
LLQIEAAHDSFGFQLEGTKRAITLLERCLERHRYAGSLNPFGGSGPEPQAPANPFAERPERPQDETWSLRDFAVSRGALRDFLVTATGGSRVELAASDAGDAYIDFAVEGIPGTYFEIPTDQRTPAAPQAFHVLTGYLAPDCRGEPTAEAIEGVENSKLQIVRGIYACELPVVYHAIVVVSEAGLDSFLVLEAPAGRRGAVEALGRKLYTALAGRGDSFQGVSLRY